MSYLRALAMSSALLAGVLAPVLPAAAQSASETLIVAGPRTPESLELEYPSTEAVQEARKNVYERLLAYEMVANEDGVMVENFDKLTGALAESWVVSDDRSSITFTLAEAKSHAGNTLSADDVMWTFERGWALKGTFYWYMHQMLKIQDFSAFQKVDDRTVKVQLPGPSPLIERLWVNSDLGIIDATEVKKHLTAEDTWGTKWLSTNTASFSPYKVTTFTPGREIVYEANLDYYRGEPKLKKIIFREIPTSANRVAALQAGSIDVAEWLLPRELDLLSKSEAVKIWKVYGNYIHRVDLTNTIEPFTDKRVRQALNYLVPRDQIGKSVYFDTARPTKSPVSEIYPAYTDEFFTYSEDVEKAKALLAEAGYADGFKTELGYRTGDEIEEQIAIILKTSFARAGVDLQLSKLPSSTLVERYTGGTIPAYFLRDMAIVPDAAYVTNLWLNSQSMVDFSRYKNTDVDALIDKNLTATVEAERIADMKQVQQMVVEDAPWVFLFNPGYQLATRANIKGTSWYTPNGNAWFDYSKE
ncbi:ABC transporter substrate-binding protein [Methylobrevis sp. L22]|uniref:ABC transporter substrate-binding protein n=2 Tax=Methylobrevis albus TaxID=2793297 RepID=A0A931MYF4_9HYPH|nr:ABC transporter substrate-binding protein [Methylobrevis albus]